MVLRNLALPLSAAVVLDGLLIGVVRWTPIDMPRALQLVLTLALVAALAVLILAVSRANARRNQR